MNKLRNIIVLIISIFPATSFAQTTPKTSLPAVLKADKIDADQENNTVVASGNVEFTKDGSILTSKTLSFDKNLGDVKADGDVKITNYDIGSVLAKDANVKSDLKSGYFNDARIVFNDGSYIESPKINRQSENKTVFYAPIFSICPNDEIKENNYLAGKDVDTISIKASSTTIDKEDERIRTKNGVIRFYDVPVLYTPYISVPTPSSERKSGFLHPSYVRSTQLGAGIKLPYYFNIAPDKDLTTYTQYHPDEGHLIINNKYRHLLENGYYNADLELANNRPKNNLIVGGKPTNQEARWYLKSQGDIKLSEKSAIDFTIDNTGDKNYLRDYHNNFVGYAVSHINLDHISDRDYASIKTVKMQELEPNIDSTTEPTALPIINLYKEMKPKNSWFNQTYGLLFNSTVIYRENGLQYRRASIKPEVKIPYNLSGNLFELGASVQGDFYNLENNFASTNTTANTSNFDSTDFNYRPEASLKWSLPMVGKYQTSTIVIEPLVNMVVGSFKNDFNKIPTEDSQDTELTQSNLFLNDRFTGFDRSEDGKRITYGIKSSLFNDKIGQFNFGIGQGWRSSSTTQDVVLRGFNDSSKSNLVGQIGYRSPKIFSINYNFQLSESNYRNDVNELNARFTFERFYIDNNFIFLRQTVNNLTEQKQLSTSFGFNITKKLVFNVINNRDIVLERNITRRYGLFYNGCCVSYGFSVSEDSPIAIARPQKSYNFNFAIKNL